MELVWRFTNRVATKQTFVTGSNENTPMTTVKHREEPTCTHPSRISATRLQHKDTPAPNLRSTVFVGEQQVCIRDVPQLVLFFL